MAPVVMAAAAFVVKVGTVVVAAYKASAIVRMAIHVAAMFAVSAITKALAAKPGKIDQGQELQLKLDSTMPRQIAAGKIATGGSQVWAFTYGDSSDVPNRYLVRIIALSDRPCESLVKVTEGDKVLSFTGDPADGLAICNQHRKKDGSPAMWLQFVPGSDTPTAVAWLVTASGGAWTANHKGTGICYAIVQYDYDTDAFAGGEPQLSFVVEGAHLYDDRESLAEGGTQLVTDPSTWEYSPNAANIALQLLRGFKTNGSLILGAQADEEDFEYGQNIAALNTCDQEIALSAGGTEPRYRAGMMLTASEPTSSMLQDLKNAMDGEIYDRNGRIAILPGGIRTPVMDLNDDDIDWTVQRSYQPLADLASLYNHVVGTYVSETLNYAQDSFPIKKDPAYVTLDGGQKITLSQDFRAVNSDTQIQRITMRLLKASRYQRVIAFTGPLWLYELQQGDWFTMTSARWGFTSKYFNVKLITLSENLSVTIIAQETAPAIDGWAPADEVDRTSDDYTPPEYRVTAPYLAVSPTSLTDPENNTELPAIAVVISNFPGSPVGPYEMEIRKTLTPEVITGLPTLNQATTFTVISAGILPGVSYQLRARIIVGDDQSDWTEWKTVVTTLDFTVENSHRFGGRTYDEVYADIDAMGEAGRDALEALVTIGDGSVDEAIDRVRVLREQADEWAEGLWDLGLGHHDLEAYVRNLGYIEGEPVKAYAVRRTTLAFDGIDALVTDMSLIGLANGDDSAFILNEDTVEIGSRGTMGTVLDALIVEDGELLAAITAEETARIDADSAIVTSIETLELDLNGPTGSITLLQELTSDMQGDIDAIVGLAIDVNGHVTGYRFANDGTTGSLTIVADEWAFVDPTDSGNVKVPFAYQAGVLVAQNMLIKSAVIEDLTIGTTKIADLAVSKGTSAFTGSSTSLGASGRSTIQSVTFDSTGGRLVLDANFFYQAISPSGGTFTYRFVVERYGPVGGSPTTVDVFVLDMTSPPITGAGDDFVVGLQSVKLTDTPAAGTWVYAIRHEILSGSGFTVLEVSHRFFLVQEFKK